MIRSWVIVGVALFNMSAAGCGEDYSAEGAPPVEVRVPAPPSAVADWMQVDSATNTVALEVVAGGNATNNNWNLNGYASGNFTVSVPEGATVTINFSNNDPNIGHSIGVSEKPAGSWPATPDPTPVFDGAISSEPASSTESTRAGESETITFTASTAGEYALVCYVPGHATAGMWINFTVEPAGAM